jgi:hypothetical protein
MLQPSNNYYYLAFGLIIESEIEFPELYEYQTDIQHIDLKISLGATPQKHEIIGFQKPISAYNENEYWQEIPNIARYYAKNGSEAIIEPLCENWNDIRLFFISNIFYAILFQRDTLPISASGVIDKNGEVVLFVAPPLIGKSTLLFQFMQKGYLPFTDEGCVFNQFKKNDYEIYVNASFPKLYLWQSILADLSITDIAEFKPIRANIKKVSKSFQETFNPKSTKLKAIVILSEAKKASTISVKKLEQMDAFIALHECHPRPEWLEDLHKTKLNFNILGFLSKNISIFSAERLYSKNDFESFANLIESTVFENGK